MQTTIAQLRCGYLRNARAYRQMAERAEKTGRPVNGYSVAEIRATAEEYAYIAMLPDKSLQDHAERARGQALARLQELRAAGGYPRG